MSTEQQVYLWLNVLDLLALGTIPGLGSPALLMVREDLGDELLPGGYYHPQNALDEMYVALCCTEERRTAIQGGLEVLGRRKLGRKIRTRETQGPPGQPWRWVSQPLCSAAATQRVDQTVAPARPALAAVA